MAGKGNSRTISAIAVPLRTDISGFTKGLKDAGKRGEKFSKDAAGAGGGLFGGAERSAESLNKALARLGSGGARSLAQLTGGMAAFSLASKAASGALNLLNGFSRIGDLGKEAEGIGATAEELSRLRNAAREAGVDFKDLSSFVTGLTGKINESIGRVDLQADSFARLGTSAEELSRLPVGEQVRKLNQGFNRIPTDAEKARVAMALAGETGIRNFRLLTMGVDEFDKAYKDGLVNTDADVSDARKLQTAVDRVVDSVEKLANTFSVMLAPRISEVADMLTAFGRKLGPMFGVAVPAAAPAPAAQALGPAAKAQAQAADPAKQARAQALAGDLAGRQQLAAAAQERVARLQVLADKQTENLRKHPGKLVPNTNGMSLRRSNQAEINKHNAAMADLNAAKREAARRADEALSPAQAAASALRLKQTTAEVNRLKGEYRESVNTSGMDEIHRRVAQIKGATPQQTKDLLTSGYQAREADRTSSLRDELQESTKLPQQKLAEDLARINKMVALGTANGGLSRAQGIRAAAMKTQESGIAGTQPQLAGALSADSVEGRSYLLSQFGRQTDPAEIARQGLALTGQSNNLLGQIVAKIGGGETVMYR